MTVRSDMPDKPSTSKSDRRYTSKQMGDATEMLVAAELTLAGVPAIKVPDNWPGYDVVAQPPGGQRPVRISVKSRTYKKGPAFVEYNEMDTFDWLAIVLLECPGDRLRRIFLLPRDLADSMASRNKPGSKTDYQRYWPITKVPELFAQFEDNFSLQRDRPTSPAAGHIRPAPK